MTAGRTEEEIDPVRLLTNKSSGRMGFALAEQAFCQGANVILIAGPNELTPLPGIEYHQIGSAEEMEQVVADNIENTDIVIASAAVSDYRPKEILFRKVKKGKGDWSIDLVQNPDILAGIGKLKGNRIVIGFAVETDNEEENARKKLNSKNLDMIVLNNPEEPGAGFATNTNKVTLLFPKKKAQKIPLLSKSEIASHIIDEIIKLVEKQKKVNLKISKKSNS